MKKEKLEGKKVFLSQKSLTQQLEIKLMHFLFIHLSFIYHIY